jgi:hypothetical protein
MGRSEDSLNGAEELQRMREMFARSPSFSALLQGPEHRFVLTNPAYHQLIGHRNVIGLAVREAVPEVEGQGFFELLDSEFLDAGMDLLPKPFELDTLGAKVNAMIEDRPEDGVTGRLSRRLTT